MTKQISAKKKKSIIDIHKKYPDLSASIIAAQHGVCSATATRFIKEYTAKQAKKNEQRQ